MRENIQFFHRFDPVAYLDVLKDEWGAVSHPAQPNAYIVREVPFYKPTLIEDHMSVMGFNYFALSSVLIDALASHPELVPDEAIVCWLIEQDLLWKSTMGNVRKAFKSESQT